MDEPKAYDPLDYRNLTFSLVRELMGRVPARLPLDVSIDGPGVYALFYDGDFAPYATLRSPDATRPIYVGKAVPPGARKGATTPNESTPVLRRRLGEHAASLEAAANLRAEDFACRYLVVVPLWITMAERFLIEHYQPCWNVSIEGFGLHDPGKGRHRGQRSWWDTLHPGRSWAEHLQPRSEAEARARLRDFTRDVSTTPETP